MSKLLRNSAIFLAVIGAPHLVFAQGVVQLTGISFVQGGDGSVESYVQALYWLAIGIGSALAVLRLVLAGAKYVLTDVVTTKGEAKKDVYAAVVGLLIILATVLILETINPQLNNLQVLQLQSVTPPTGSGAVIPERFQPRAGENLTTYACDTSSGRVECGDARTQCLASDSVVGQPTVHENTVYCYTREENATTGCDGYQAPDGTCYGSEIDLGTDFQGLRGDLRAQECTRIGVTQGLNVEYDNARGTCTIIN